MARQTSIVVAREDRRAADGHHPFAIERLENFRTNVAFDDGQLHRRQKLAVRQLRETFACARDADELLDVGVPRRDVGVANRPVVAVTVLRVRLKIQVAPTIDLPAPRDRPTTDLASAEPLEWRVLRGGVWILRVLHEELRSDFVARVAAALDGIVALERFAVAESAEGHLPRLDVFDEVGLGIDRSTSLQHERPETALSEFFCR